MFWVSSHPESFINSLYLGFTRPSFIQPDVLSNATITCIIALCCALTPKMLVLHHEELLDMLF
jgi:hypothetical protein